MSSTEGCAPGRPARVDYEYVRQGTACCLLSFAPFDGWRHVTVSAHRANADFAHAMQHLVDVDQTFPPAEARWIARKLEFHYTKLARLYPKLP
jgi:hypothetical protein